MWKFKWDCAEEPTIIDLHQIDNKQFKIIFKVHAYRPKSTAVSPKLTVILLGFKYPPVETHDNCAKWLERDFQISKDNLFSQRKDDRFKYQTLINYPTSKPCNIFYQTSLNQTTNINIKVQYVKIQVGWCWSWGANNYKFL